MVMSAMYDESGTLTPPRAAWNTGRLSHTGVASVPKFTRL